MSIQILITFGVENEPVGNVESSVDGALERAEDLGASGGARQPDVQVAPESAGLSVHVLHGVILAIGFRHSSVDVVQTKLIWAEEEIRLLSDTIVLNYNSLASRSSTEIHRGDFRLST